MSESGLGLPMLRAPRTIHFRIVSLVLLILLPLLAAFGLMAFELARSRIELIERERADIAAMVTSEVEREITGASGLLRGLAGSVDLLKGRREEFRQSAEFLTSGSSIARIWALTPGGETLAGSGAANSEAVRGLSSDLIERAFRGEDAVSAVHGVGPDAAVLMVVPFRRGGDIPYALAAEVHVRRLSTIFAKAGLPSSWAAGVVDRNGRFIARSIDAERRLGQQAQPELRIAANSAAPTGEFENVTLEGVPMLNSYHRSSFTGWTTVVAVPKSTIVAPVRRGIFIVLVGGLGAVLLTLIAAYAYARRISEPVLNLGIVASALAKGERYSPARHPLHELEEVQKALEAEVAESAHLAAVVNSSGDAIMSISLDGLIQTWNPAAERLFGYTAEEIIGRPKSLLVPADRMDEFVKQQAEVAAGNSLRIETMRKHRNGTLISVSVDAAPVRRPDGTIVATSSILHDITQRIADEEHRGFLMREIAHRSKNQLAIIQAIASQTARTSVTTAQFLERFRERLQGLAASHDLLFTQNWRGAPLDKLIRSQIDVFVGAGNSAVRISGPPAVLNASAAEAIGLAIHELATNSAKYGALSVPTGTVSVEWRETAADIGRSWELTWREAGGPPVEAPKTTGFGTHVIERMTAIAVQGTSEIEYHPSGLRWRLVIPASAMLPISLSPAVAGLSQSTFPPASNEAFGHAGSGTSPAA